MKAKQNLSILALILATKVIWSATLYVDSGAVYSLNVVNQDDYLYDMSVWDMQSSNSISSVHLRPRWLWRDDVAQLSCINAPWSIDKGDFHVFTPNLYGGGGDVSFQNLEIKKVYTGFPVGDESLGDDVVCYRDGKVVDRRKDDVFAMARKGLGITGGETLVGRDEVVHVLSDRNADARPGLLRSDFSSSWAIGDPSNKVIWSALDGCHWITRMPLWDRNSKAWRPCIRPGVYRWGQGKIDFSKFSNGTEELCVCDVDFDGNGFNPCAAVYVVGRNVLSDNPRFAVSGEADWLIWERDGEKSRLCKMHDGKWYVVSDAPCADVPGVIVVNNDENIVFLSFSLKFDDGDVDASMRRVVTHLRGQGALHLNRLKVPVPDPDEGLSEFEKSCREDAVRQARLIEENRRRNAEELARLDAERAAANHEAEAAWLAKRKEDAIRKNSRTAGMHTGSDLSPEEIDVRLPKKAIADAILQWPKEGTEFFLTYENKQCYRNGKMGMPMKYAFVFGLVPANVLFSSVVTPRETQDEDGETFYFYDAISPSARRRSTYMNSDFYYPQFSLERCVCRIVFAHREVSPDFSHLQPLTMPLKNGKCEKLSPANVWDVRGIEESKYMSEFSNRVFKICRIGFFGIPFASAVAFVNNTATRQDDAKELRIEPTPKTAHLNVLDPREISEVVYWLWRRKGKTDEYAGFVKAHPELFEPIASEDEFRTELGRRLIGTWK